jgi:hypothetical protein
MAPKLPTKRAVNQTDWQVPAGKKSPNQRVTRCEMEVSMNKSDQKSANAADRRNFLKLAAAGTVAGGVAVAAGTASAAPAPDPSADEGHYRETAHIKRYYDLARF